LFSAARGDGAPTELLEGLLRELAGSRREDDIALLAARRPQS
jgi:hypothetical protein